MVRTFCLLFTLMWSVAVMATDTFDHHRWDKLVKQQVITFKQGQQSTVNYQALSQNPTELITYLKELETISKETFNRWAQNDQLAFLINTYNAWTIQLVLSAYPDLKSIKELGHIFRTPWRKPIVRLFGDIYSLDDIEHDLIRGSDQFQDPRIHFALNCASIGCPALRAEAFVGSRLDTQLEAQTNLFLSDRDRNYFSGNILYVSSIFKWYREDFEKGWRGYNSLHRFLGDYSESLGLTASQSAILKSGDMKIRFLKYDWHLNDSAHSK